MPAAAGNTQKATITTGTPKQWKTTTLDGFGRVIKVQTVHDSTAVSEVDSQYAPCAYDSQLRLTSIQTTGYQLPTLVNMQYVYPTSADNGRITRTIDGVTGETVNYTYDQLNRLATATAECMVAKLHV